MAPPLIQLKDIKLTFGGTPLLSGVELSVSSGERVCPIGRNGSGKSTLLKIAAGIIEPDGGSRFVQPGATIRYLPQEPDFGDHKTTLAYVEAGLNPGDDHYQARYLLEQLGLHGDEDPAHVSGGEARRAALARALAPAPDILLLDEPTNHLDLPTIEWLERELAGIRSGIVLISHDRRLLERFSRNTVWLDGGITRVLDEGFSEFEAWRDAVLEQEESEQHKLGRKIAMEEDWLRYGVTARRTRNQRRLAELHALRRRRREYRVATGTAQLDAAQADLSGRLVAMAEGISKAYGDHVVVRNFSLRVMRGDRLGIVGPNGAGKTTLLNLLTGGLPPDAGEVRLGTNLVQVTLDQRRESLDRVVTSTIATDGNGRWVEYAGGYTDMLAQRAAGSRGAPPPKTRNTKRSRPATQTSELSGSLPRRMNFSDRRALDLLPARIAALEARITELNAVLADLDLYRRDPARFRDTTDALAITRDELAAGEDQWLRLEMLREDIEGIEPKA